MADADAGHHAGATLGFVDLVAHITTAAGGRRRYLFGLAGPPGSGKSTVAARLADELGGVVVAMDGFHLDNV
ncbi:MAG TPA: AAA family ATPase, partial [Ilumatobacteraceae bacterium]|nr:AAA family ATPase [Ilumatobacteraceae bacterium]